MSPSDDSGEEGEVKDHRVSSDEEEGRLSYRPPRDIRSRSFKDKKRDLRERLSQSRLYSRSQQTKQQRHHHHHQQQSFDRRKKREMTEKSSRGVKKLISNESKSFQIQKQEENFKSETKIEVLKETNFEKEEEKEKDTTSGSSSSSESEQGSNDTASRHSEATPEHVEDEESELENEIPNKRARDGSFDKDESLENDDEPLSEENYNEEEEKEEKEILLPPYLPSIHGCRSAEEFQYLNRIEEGTFGVVYRARDRKTNEVVAMKRLKMEREKEGFPITSLREINTLLIAQHPNVVTVREIVVGSNMDRIFIVMDFVEHDLKSLMKTMQDKKQSFLAGEVKCLMIQLLTAIAHLHDNWILHRDLKSSNLLLSHNGILKVGDFGLAREYGSPLKPYTSLVVTLWYRAPELLLGIKQYTTHIDVWSIGCLFGEFLLMEPLFPGKSDIDQLNKLFKLLGTPHEKIWPGYNSLPAVQKMKFVDYPISHMRSKFPNEILSGTGMELLRRFFTYDPSKRISCEEALKSQYFKETPLPIDPSMFPTWPAKSELGSTASTTKTNHSPKPPSGGGAFKQLNEEDDDSKLGFNFISRNSVSVAPGWNLKF